MELFFIMCLVICMATSGSADQLYNVMQFGAVGNGVTDDSQAFSKGWEAVCGDASNKPTLVIPEGKTFLVQPISFHGPCKSSTLRVQIDGDVIAPKDPSTWKQKVIWLSFLSLKGFTVDGNGKIDGQGSNWWKLCSKPYAKDCKRPTALAFHRCANFHVSGLNSINSPKNHISIKGCRNGTFSNLQLTASKSSPNTDGIDIGSSRNIQILGGTVATGDDCVAVNSGSSHIKIAGLACGPGHGISVGSLGKHGDSAAVEEVHVSNCTLTSTQNGLRIKTWQGGSGYARKITFEDIEFIRVHNPIIIDQFYCPHQSCSNKAGAVHVSDISYTNIRGTSIAKDAIAFNCSQTVGCNNIVLQHINITPANRTTMMEVQSSCINAYGKADDTIPSVNCLH